MNIRGAGLFFFLFFAAAFCAFGRGRQEAPKNPAAMTVREQNDEMTRAIEEAGYAKDKTASLSRIAALLDAGVDPNQNRERPFLHRAVRYNSVDAARLLLDRGADIHARDNEGAAAVHYAARYGGDDAAMLRLLAERGARFDTLDGDKRSPLHLAANSRERFAFILAWEQTNSPDFSGGASSRKDYLASLFGRGSTVMLIDVLAAAGEPLDGRNAGGESPAQYAARVEGKDGRRIIRLLMDRGIRFDITGKGKTPLEYSAGEDAAFLTILEWEETHAPDFSGGKGSRAEYLSALVPALCRRRGYLKELEALFAAGADYRALTKTEGEETILTRDVQAFYVPFLLEQGLPVNIRDSEGKTFLYKAAASSDMDLAIFLLGRGEKDGWIPADRPAADRPIDHPADPNIADNRGRTPLMEASQTEMIRLLLRYGADPAAADHRGRTALHYLYTTDAEGIELLAAAGADLNAEDSRGFTPVMSAVEASVRPETLKKLLQLGADPQKKTPDGKNLLLLYLEDGAGDARPDIVKILMEAGVDPAETDNKGNSALIIVFRAEKDSAGKVQKLRDILTAGSPEAGKAARAEVRREERAEYIESVPYRLAYTAPLLLPLGYIGLSVWMREGVYRDNREDNWMGGVNAFTAGFGGAGTLCFAGFLAAGKSVGGWDGIGVAFLGIAASPVAGLIGGIALAAIPESRRAFAENPFLYYLPSASLGIITGMFLYRIWLD